MVPSGGKKSAAAVRKFTSVGILKIRKERITSEKVALGHMIYRSYSVKKKNSVPGCLKHKSCLP